MSDRGFVAMDRDVFDHPLLAGKKRCDLAAWTWLIREAAWRPERIHVAGQTIELQRGQVAHSIRHMAREWKWSVKKVRTFLKRWTREKAISVGLEKGTGGSALITVITICNYDRYQGLATARGTAKGTGGAQEGHKVNQVTKEEEDRDEMRSPSENVSQPDFKKLASDLNDRIVIIFGFDPDFIPPGWCGLEYALDAGLRGNKWDPEICRIAAVKLAAKKKPDTFTYLIKAIHTEHQDTAQMLKRMEAANVVQPNQRELALVTTINGGFARKGGGFAAVGQKAFKAGSRS